MIIRIWNGTTTADNADSYEQLLNNVVFPGIAQKQVEGYLGIQLLKKAQGDEVNFITIMRFENLESVKQFAGEDYEKSYVIDQAKALLKQYDAKVAHYELVYNSLSF